MNKRTPNDKKYKERLYENVDIANNECWNWTGKTSHNAGRMSYYGKSMYAYKVSYSLYKGPIEKGEFINHHCDNRLCCNPKHLYKGTYEDNQTDQWVFRNRLSLNERIEAREKGWTITISVP